MEHKVTQQQHSQRQLIKHPVSLSSRKTLKMTQNRPFISHPQDLLKPHMSVHVSGVCECVQGCAPVCVLVRHWVYWAERLGQNASLPRPRSSTRPRGSATCPPCCGRAVHTPDPTQKHVKQPQERERLSVTPLFQGHFKSPFPCVWQELLSFPAAACLINTFQQSFGVLTC